MKLNDFNVVACKVRERAAIIDQRDNMQLGVTIGGKYQDDELVIRVRPIVVHELNRRIIQIEGELQALGVSMS